MDCYNVKELLKFLGEASVSMDAKLMVAGGSEITRLTYSPDEDVMYFDEEKENENEKLAKLVADLSYKNTELEAQVASLRTIVEEQGFEYDTKRKELEDELAEYEIKIDNLTEQRDSCKSAYFGYIAENGKLKKERDKLIKELREARKEYDDLKYSKIICPGKAAKYYLEGYRKLIKENNALKDDNDDLKKLYEKILVLTDKTTDMVIAVIDQKSREEHTP